MKWKGARIKAGVRGRFQWTRRDGGYMEGSGGSGNADNEADVK